MKAFLLSLMSGDERGVDSVITLGVFAFFFLCGMTVYAVIKDPAAWSPTTFMAASTGIIGSVAAGKTARDRWATQQAGGQQ